ncbi:MAG: class I tRNA ligase family protein, partial [Bacillota bacterium]|nr:class I tRNA ligase family protein [Bacillota bacterium]
MLSPVLAFTAEEVWGYLPQQNKADSVQLAGWPTVNQEYIDGQLEERWEKIIDLRDEVSKTLEKARRDKVIGHSLDAQVNLYLDQELFDFLKNFPEKLDTIFIVSKVELLQGATSTPEGTVDSTEYKGLKIQVVKAPGSKCERCWKYCETVGQSQVHPQICSVCETNLK